jgi:hypothetical protein
VTYQTHALPPFGDISPTVERDDATPEYVLRTARTLHDIFGTRQDLDRPERDAPRYAKPLAVDAARACHEQTADQTLSECCALISERATELATERDVADLDVTPRVLAVATYANVVQSLDWGVSELGDEWDADALVLVHDSLRDLADLVADEEEVA